MSQNGTVYQRDKKNKSRPKEGEIGYVSAKGKYKKMIGECKICRERFILEEMGRHQRTYLCFKCQPKLFI